MAKKPQDPPKAFANGLVDEESGDEDALVSLMEAGNNAAQNDFGKPASGPAGEDAVRAIVKSLTDRNLVLLGLVNIGNPENRTSITLSPENTVRMAEKLLAEALNLPEPPDRETVTSALARLLKLVEKKRR